MNETTGVALSANGRGRQAAVVLAVLVLLVVAAFVMDVATGSVFIAPRTVLRGLLGADGVDPAFRDIVRDLRLPKALTAALAGAALATSGLLMQTFFRNPLAGPFVLGINSGASLGVALVLLSAGGAGASMLGALGLVQSLGVVAAAIVGASAVLVLVLLAAHRVDTLTLLVLGVLFGYATSALVSVLLRFAAAEQIQVYVEWGFGGFGGVTWSQLAILSPIVVSGLAAAAAVTKPLNALLLGETYARSLGLGARGVRLAVLGAAAVLAGVVTAFCGPIAFLGVAVPHLARGLLRTADHRWLIPATVLLGACLALAADLVAQVPGSPTVLPLNAITALIGAPVVIWIVLRRPTLRGVF